MICKCGCEAYEHFCGKKWCFFHPIKECRGFEAKVFNGNTKTGAGLR